MHHFRCSILHRLRFEPVRVQKFQGLGSALFLSWGLQLPALYSLVLGLQGSKVCKPKSFIYSRYSLQHCGLSVPDSGLGLF